MTPILGVIDSAKSGNLGTPSWDSIATYSGGATSQIVMGSIPSTYKHLRLVLRLKDSRTGPNYSSANISFNAAPGGTSHAYTWLYGDNRGGPFEDSSSASGSIPLSICGTSTSSGNIFGFATFDIFDYANTSNFKGVQGQSGFVDAGTSLGGQVAFMNTGVFVSTTTISSIYITPAVANFTSSIRASLYGIKG
jgi:hypothetical protein